MWEFAFAIAVVVVFLPAARAQDADDDATIIRRLAGDGASGDDWIWAARKIADKQSRNEIRDALKKRDGFPRGELVELLTDQHLAVRLGALELLEEAAGDGYGFNPWASPGGEGADPRNEHALQVWRNWAGETGEVAGAGPVLSDEQMQAYIRDIISGNDERKKRAVRMLEPHGMKGVADIQEFIEGHPGLPGSSRVGLKEAQYHLVLSRTAGENASALARDLARGNRDQQLGGISALKRSGFLAIPIVRDFLGSNDALVRETAVDTILSLGGLQAVPLVAPYLKDEKDVNVIHAAMRRFREIGGKEALEIITPYLDHPDEDLVVASIQSITKLTGSSRSGPIFSSSEPARAKGKASTAEKIAALLDDPRWRIRAAALEFVSARHVESASDRVIELLGDEDEFVRSNAISAAVSMGLTDAEDRLRSFFLNDDEMVVPTTEAFTSMGKPLTANLIKHLDTRPVDVIVGAIRALDCDKKYCLETIARYAVHDNLDVACAALRVLGDDEDKLGHSFVANHLTAALRSGNDEKITAVLDTIDLPRTATKDLSLMRLIGSHGGEETTLDPLYEAFLEPLRKAAEEAEEAVPAVDPGATGGLATLLDVLADHSGKWEHAERAFRASLLLAKAGDKRGLTSLIERVGELSVSERAAIADGLYYVTSKEALPLIRSLLHDDVPNVRQEAASAAFREAGAVVMIEMALAQLDVEGTKLTAPDLYGYSLERAAADRKSKRVIRKWCKRVLAEDDTPDETKILALVLMRNSLLPSDEDSIERFTKSDNQWIRRAAWYSLGTAGRTWLQKNLQGLVDDPSPRVREVLPWASGNLPGTWSIYFSDNNRRDERSYSSARAGSFPAALADALQKLAESDPSPEVRFESWFALLANSKPIDLEAFIALIPQQPQESDVGVRIADHLEENYRRMGQGMKPLLAYADMKEDLEVEAAVGAGAFLEGGGRCDVHLVRRSGEGDRIERRATGGRNRARSRGADGQAEALAGRRVLQTRVPAMREGPQLPGRHERNGIFRCSRSIAAASQRTATSCLTRRCAIGSRSAGVRKTPRRLRPGRGGDLTQHEAGDDRRTPAEHDADARRSGLGRVRRGGDRRGRAGGREEFCQPHAPDRHRRRPARRDQPVRVCDHHLFPLLPTGREAQPEGDPDGRDRVHPRDLHRRIFR